MENVVLDSSSDSLVASTLLLDYGVHDETA